MPISRLLLEFKTPELMQGTHTPFITDIGGSPALFFSAYDNIRRFVLFMQQEGTGPRKIIADGKSMCAPWVVPVRTGGYRLYATILNSNGRYGIKAYFSADGLMWVPEAPLDINVSPNTTSPCVIPHGGGAMIFFTGADHATDHLVGKLYRASSDDGITLFDIEEVTLPPSPRLQSRGVFKPNIFKIGARWVMYVSEVGPDGLWYVSVYHSDDLDSWVFSRHLLSGDSRFQFYKPVVYEDTIAVVIKGLDGNTSIQFDRFNPAIHL